MTAFIFPGQGAGSVGMGKDVYDKFLCAKEIFQMADEILHFHLSKLIFNGPHDKLFSTQYAQSALFVMGAAILEVMKQELPELTPTICGGLSLGEYTALLGAKKIGFQEGLKLVWNRGNYMFEDSQSSPGMMAAVLGLTETEVVKAGFWVANVNSPGQVVIAGTEAEIEKAKVLLKEAGARKVIPLNVSGAFHSAHMKNAQKKLEPEILEANILTSDIDLVMNVPAEFVGDVEEIKRNLVEQMCAPTYWMRCMEKIIDRGPQRIFEIGPKQLTGMITKMQKVTGTDIPCINIEKLEDLEVVYESIK